MLIPKPKFLALMREYSNSENGSLFPVESFAWRQIKRRLVEDVTIRKVLCDPKGIYLPPKGTEYWDVSNVKNLDKFIEFIYLNESMLNYSDTTTVGCADSVTYYNTNSTITNSYDSIDNLNARMTVLENAVENMTKKENSNMKDMFSFDFGKITSDAVRVSMYGIAVKSVDGHYVSYDNKTHSVMDVEILNMPAGDFLYKMPVAIKDIKAGDVVIHNRTPMFVVEVHASTLKVVDVREGTEKEIYLTKSPFGFNFATKVVSLMDMTGAKADESNPFGNMLPFLMLGDGKSVDPMMIMLATGGKMDMSNPMMLYFLMKDGNKNDMLPFLMMGLNPAVEDAK